MFNAFRHPSFGRAAGVAQQEALEAALERRPDVVFAHRLGAMAPILGTSRPLPPLVFDLYDIEHRALARAIRQPPVWPAKYLAYLQLPALWWAERRAMIRADRTFVCSASDREYLRRTMRVEGVEVLWSIRPIATRPFTWSGNLASGPPGDTGCEADDRGAKSESHTGERFATAGNRVQWIR